MVQIRRIYGWGIIALLLAVSCKGGEQKPDGKQPSFTSFALVAGERHPGVIDPSSGDVRVEGIADPAAITAVEYTLTERGHSLVAVLDKLCDWGMENRP